MRRNRDKGRRLGLRCTCVVVVWTWSVSACRVRLSCHSFMSWGLSSSLPLPSLFRMKRRGGVGALMTALARTPSLSPTHTYHNTHSQKSAHTHFTISAHTHYFTISAHAIFKKAVECVLNTCELRGDLSVQW
jgi:hypothetical protein